MSCTVSESITAAEHDSAATIGKGMACHTWIVDPRDHNRLVPVGAVGELIIQGFSIADGYLHNALATSKVFINPPSWTVEVSTGSIPDTRFYKTGDLV